ncbi:MAG: sigma-70 family RNA polymerase sigma factor [Myxococcota bacterium]|nr:sigma-70 family RNA polymerase sigma factor [Myxococcota bacterium]
MLADAFLAAIPADERVDATNLEAALRDAVDRGRAAHPDICIDDTAFAAYFAAHLEDGPPQRWLASRNAPDAYLACAIAQRDGRAVATFARTIEPAVRAVVARLVKDDDLAADVVAAVREKLVVGLDARGPRIADYGGHGELLVWVRVIAIRAALTQLRTHRRHVPVDDELWEVASPSADPALTALKRDSTARIKDAFHAGLAALTTRQRNLLRQHLLDGLTIDELGAIYQVHRVTCARWLTSARADLWSHTRAELRQTLGVSDQSISDMLEDIRSTLDLSIERVLARI